QIIIRIGVEKFCGIVSDSTGNTRLAQQLIIREFPTIIALPDVCHFLSLICKEIAKLDYFEKTLKTVRGTVAFFHKSHLGIKQLTDELKSTGETRALEAIGKTRICTIIHACASVRRCTSAIKKVVALGDVKFETETSFQPGGKLSQQTQDFAFKNSQLLALGLPIAKAVHCLESNDANANDVYLLVHAVMLEIEEVVRDLDNDFPLDIQAEVIALLNQRYAQLFDPTSLGNIASKAFLVAAYLNPSKLDFGVCNCTEKQIYSDNICNGPE
ncbi:hypothetical protein GGU10DRAFT_275801, partial [Lentinula aff. detonsa]